MTSTRSARRVALAALLYFGCVFGAGFVFGAFRVTLLVPRLGVRWAELAEMPLMACVIVLAARWTVRRAAPPFGSGERLAAGALALGLVLVAEVALAAVLQGLSPRAYATGRDPVSGSVYAALLLVFAALPWWIGHRRGG